MIPGDVVLIRLPGASGRPAKLRPALVLAALPGPYQNVLICGVSTQVRDVQSDWDELIDRDSPDFEDSGLRRASAIRLSYLYAAEVAEISGVIGRIGSVRLERLRERLAERLRP